MDLGILLSDVPREIDPADQLRDLLRLVEAAQEAGFNHIAIGQHFLYGDLRWLQPVPLLARLAAEVDPSVRLVTQVLVVPFYHPVLLAEELATLDIVTEGRLIFGGGLGYRREEFDHLEVPYAERAARTDEAIELIRTLWTEDEVTFHGRFWSLDGVQTHIRPVQQPHPPIWIGGHSLAGARRAGRLGDGYAIPPETTVAEARERLALVEEGFAARGREPTPQPLRRNVWIGDTREDALAGYAAAAQGRYVAYAQRGLDLYEVSDLEQDFLASVADHAVLGTADEVVAQLLDIVTTLPVEPLLLRPQWPSMTTDQAIEVIGLMGSSVVPALAEVASRARLGDGGDA